MQMKIGYIFIDITYISQQQGQPFYQNNPYQSTAAPPPSQQYHNPYHRQSTLPNFNTPPHQLPHSLQQSNFNNTPLQRSNTFSKTKCWVDM